MLDKNFRNHELQDPIIIIGAGQAGLKAAETLRQKKFNGDITLIGDEPYYPYQRPPLSKAYVKGELDEDRLLLKPESWFLDQKITVLRNFSAKKIDPKKKKVILSQGEGLSYSKLLLATGTKARTLSIPGAELEGVHTLRGLEDTKKIRPDLEHSQSIVIIGGGFIGLEFAAAARSMGKNVTVLEDQDRILKRVAGPEISTFLTQMHNSRGVRLLTSHCVKEIEGNSRVKAIFLESGERLFADCVLIAAGAVARTRLAMDAGIKTHRGILVDKTGQTSAEHIYAAGDCTVFPSANYGRLIGLESVQNACDQAKSVAAAMLGEMVCYDPIPWFWSDQYDKKLQIAGLLEGYRQTKIVGSVENEKFSIEYYCGPKLLAVHSINDPRSHMMARKRLAEKKSEAA